MSPHSDTLSWFWAKQFLFFFLNVACLAEKQHINYFMVFGLNRSGLEHTIYRTRGERANHYTKDALILKVKALSPILHFCHGMEWAGLKDEWHYAIYFISKY
jgi:hypothetical protein